MMPIRVVADGEKHRIVRWAATAKELDKPWWGCPKTNKSDRTKIGMLLVTWAEHGFPKNHPQKFKTVEGKLSEIKGTSQYRLLGFFDGEDYVIVLCVKKKQDDLRPQDVKKAKELMEHYHGKDS
jgi:hypothetical protein